MITLIHRWLWGPWLMGLFVVTGIVFSIRSGVFQVFGIRVWWSETVGSLWNNKEKEKKQGHGMTQIQSACTALAATIGTGNIVGVATALTAGGPGAVFWMWISAGIGMMTAYAETVLGMECRYLDRTGRWMGGPMVYMEKLLGCPRLGVFYAGCCGFAALGMGSMVQSNSLAETVVYTWNVKPILTAVVLTAVVCLVIFGGIGRIALVTERLIPAAAGIYILFSMMVILSCYDRIPGVMADILRSAFLPEAMAGGAAGYGISRSLRFGMSRGVFSNEAGLGSLAILHSAAEDQNPAKQGMWAMFEVFMDTIVICTMTALVILCLTNGRPWESGYDGAALAAWCFSGRLGAIGETLVSMALVVFAFATIIAWFFLGRQAVTYLADRMGWQTGLLQYAYLMLYLNAVFYGCLAKISVVWELSDIGNGCMAVPNLIALLLLAKRVKFPSVMRGRD